MRTACALPLLGLTACVLALPFDSLTGGPSSLYSLDETESAIAHDTYNRRQGSLDSETAEGYPKWTPNGFRRGGLAFGQDGWIDFVDLSGQKVPHRATVAMWIYFETLPRDDGEPTDAELLSVENDSPTDFGLQALAVFVGGFGEVRFERATSAEKRILRTPAIAAKTWVLVAAGWDLSQNRAVLYVRPNGQAALPLQVGDLPPGFVFDSPGFAVSMRDGTLDELRYYDRLLEPGELAALE